jgi:hypothetical protein
MVKIKQGFKITLLLLGLAIYFSLFLINFTHAEPAGAEVTNISTESYNSSAGGRQDRGGTITTITLDTTQQNTAWKAYVGNISGKLVLRNSGGWSIYEWSLNASSVSGYVFVSRNDSITWTSLRCANNTIISSEEIFFGMSSTDSDSLNNTFNSTIHKAMTGSLSSPISNGSCRSTATYVNGSAQTMDQDVAYFQEILLYDTSNIIYGTFIDQNKWGFNNNASVNITYDFQLMVAENSSSLLGTVYYFYAYLNG